MDRWDLERKIIMHALRDADFKRKLKSHPKEAIQDYMRHEKIPGNWDNANVRIVEEKRGEWSICLPNIADSTLSEAELKRLFAAGGANRDALLLTRDRVAHIAY
jgi:hypothetical protein